MPAAYVLTHLAITAAAIYIAARVPGRRVVTAGLAVGLLLLVVGGMVIERSTALSWAAMRLGWPDLVFFTNLSLEGVALLLGGLWRQAATRGARWRAGVLAVPALCAALWSYAWFFRPLPPGLHGGVDRTGFCSQTTDDSCSAAAAVMLLHRHGIRSTEAEMARLCLTRAGHGTPPLGLYRGVATRARGAGLHPRLFILPDWSRLGTLPTPSILSIGLKRGAPGEITQRMEGYGWQPGHHHAVVVLAADPAGKWLDVADPSYGRERWPTADIEYLWDGRALVLDRR